MGDREDPPEFSFLKDSVKVVPGHVKDPGSILRITAPTIKRWLIALSEAGGSLDGLVSLLFHCSHLLKKWR